jgi:hypothetical protein
MYHEMQKPRNVSAVNVAPARVTDFSLIDFVETNPTTIAIAQPTENPTIFATTGATASVIDDEAIVRCRSCLRVHLWVDWDSSTYYYYKSIAWDYIWRKR